MSEFSWFGAYYSDLQSLYALLVIPIAFLIWRAAASAPPQRSAFPPAARFVSGLTIFFAIETMIDPIATGPFVKLEVMRDSFATTAIPFIFVLLGDLRVLLLAIGVARPERGLRNNLMRALAVSLLIPIVTFVCFTTASWIWPELPGKVLWMIYEFGFLSLSIYLARVWVPKNVGQNPTLVAFLQSVFAFSAAYYALWFLADVVIVLGELDLGWGLRMVPNQLYYAFWVPYVYWRFFSVGPTLTAPSAST